eukprot:m.1311926 g.1311926  ORF g.1311926 m.1311926 type:complete len:214 (-) comp24829_c1_seq59:2014-2655(-)
MFTRLCMCVTVAVLVPVCTCRFCVWLQQTSSGCPCSHFSRPLMLSLRVPCRTGLPEDPPSESDHSYESNFGASIEFSQESLANNSDNPYEDPTIGRSSSLDSTVDLEPPSPPPRLTGGPDAANTPAVVAAGVYDSPQDTLPRGTVAKVIVGPGPNEQSTTEAEPALLPPPTPRVGALLLRPAKPTPRTGDAAPPPALPPREAPPPPLRARRAR